MADEAIKNLDGQYRYGFKDDTEPIYITGEGLSEEVARKISAVKSEPKWMLDIRPTAYKTYRKLSLPSFRPDLAKLDYKYVNYFRRDSDFVARKWENVPEDTKKTFDRLGVPQAEREYSAGSNAQYESEVVYHSIHKQSEDMGTIFMGTDTTVQKYPDLVKKYSGKLVLANDNKLATLDTAVWSDGTSIYVSKGVSCPTLIRSYFRVNTDNFGQFEKTLIIVDEGAHVNYVEGCTAPSYPADLLHATIVEVSMLEDAYCRYTTIQNWSNNAYSLETKRAQALENATMEWVDGNLGSKVAMKYLSIYLNGQGAHRSMLSITSAGKGIDSDIGATTTHNVEDTYSSTVSKSLCKDGSIANYRGHIRFSERYDGSFVHTECNTTIMDNKSSSDAIPFNGVLDSDVSMRHETKASKISEEQLYYLMSRGISEGKATEVTIMDLAEPFTKEPSMEYAVELNRLVQLNMSDGVR